jgi:hypothetical protein
MEMDTINPLWERPKLPRRAHRTDHHMVKGKAALSGTALSFGSLRVQPPTCRVLGDKMTIKWGVKRPLKKSASLQLFAGEWNSRPRDDLAAVSAMHQRDAPSTPTGSLLDQLTEAYHGVAESERDVSRQREVVATSEREHRDCSAARKLLAQYEAHLAAHIGERARLLAELFPQRESVSGPTPIRSD